MNNKSTEDKIKDKIYKILYDKSRVDGIRYVNEDEWPIDELSSAVKEAYEEGRREAYAECMRNKTDFSEAKDIISELQSNKDMPVFKHKEGCKYGDDPKYMHLVPIDCYVPKKRES